MAMLNNLLLNCKQKHGFLQVSYGFPVKFQCNMRPVPTRCPVASGLGYGKPATTKIKVLAHGTRQALNDRGYVVGMEW